MSTLGPRSINTVLIKPCTYKALQQFTKLRTASSGQRHVVSSVSGKIQGWRNYMINDVVTVNVGDSEGQLDVFCILEGCGLVLPSQVTSHAPKPSVTGAVVEMLPRVIRSKFGLRKSRDVEQSLEEVYREVENRLKNLAEDDLWRRLSRVIRKDYGVSVHVERDFMSALLKLASAYRERWKSLRVKYEVEKAASDFNNSLGEQHELSRDCGKCRNCAQCMPDAEHNDAMNEEELMIEIDALAREYRMVAISRRIREFTANIAQTCYVSSIYDVQGVVMQIFIVDAARETPQYYYATMNAALGVNMSNNVLTSLIDHNKEPDEHSVNRMVNAWGIIQDETIIGGDIRVVLMNGQPQFQKELWLSPTQKVTRCLGLFNFKIKIDGRDGKPLDAKTFAYTAIPDISSGKAEGVFLLLSSDMLSVHGQSNQSVNNFISSTVANFTSEEGREAMKILLNSSLAKRRKTQGGHENMCAIAVAIDTRIKEDCRGPECKKYEKGTRGINKIVLYVVLIFMLIVLAALGFLYKLLS